jgi:dihydroflavonol-4-reductase
MLVTGAAGFLGSEVVRQLLAQGCFVRGTVRAVESPKNNFLKLLPGAAERLELVQATLDDVHCWKDACAGCLAVFHVASPVPTEAVDDDKIDALLVQPAVCGVNNVLSAASAAGVKHVVMTSSVSTIYDGQEDKRSRGHAFSEADSTPIPLPRGGLAGYITSKVLAEQAAFQYITLHPDFSFATIHPSAILGPCLSREHTSSVTIVRELLARKMPAVPAIYWPVCDVRDVAAAHIAAICNPAANGQRFLVSSGGMWYPEVARILSAEFDPLGFNVPTHNLPTFVLKLAGLFDGQAKLAAGMAGKDTNIDSSKVTRLLGLQLRTPKEAILACGHSCVRQGLVSRPRQYVEPSQ